jgi:hypothetical protein
MPPRSAILSLPEDVRAELDRRLIRRGFQDYRGLAAWLAEQGYEIGKSTVHNYGAKFEQKLAALKVATDQAKAIQKAADDNEGNLSEAVISMVQAGMFDVLTNLEDASEEKDREKRLALLGKAAKAAADVGRASVTVKRHKLDVLAKAEAAANTVSQMARKGGLSEEVIRQIEEQVLGIAR